MSSVDRWLVAVVVCVCLVAGACWVARAGAPAGVMGAPGQAILGAETPRGAGRKPSAEPVGDKQPQEDEESDKVLIDADDLRYDGSKKLYVLRDNVRIRHKDAVLTCDWAEYHEDTDSAIARGQLLLKDPETSITGDVLHIDFTDEVAVIDGNVVIVTQKKPKKEEGAAEKAQTGEKAKQGEKPAGQEGQQKAGGDQGQAAKSAPGRPEGQVAAESKRTISAQPAATKAEDESDGTQPKSISELRERKTTIYCTKVRYHYTDGEKYAWVSGPIRAEQKDRTLWADKAEYDVEDGVLKLIGNVKVKTEDGDEFQCPMAIVSVEDEWLRAEKVTGVAVRKKKGKEGGQEKQAKGSSEQAGQEAGKKQ